MTEPGLVVTTEGQVAILRVNDPKSMNALSAPVREGLTREVHRLLDAPDVRCLLITGTGDAFCAGGDIRAMDDRRATDTRARMHRHYRGWASRLLKSEKPVVMAVNGAAAGAGVSLALMGDIIIASRTAYFTTGVRAPRRGAGSGPHRDVAARHRHGAGTRHAADEPQGACRRGPADGPGGTGDRAGRSHAGGARGRARAGQRSDGHARAYQAAAAARL